MNAAMDSDLRVDRLSPSIGGWPALSLRGDEDVPNNRSDSAYLTRGVAIDGRRPNECPYARPVWQLPDRAESWFVEGDQGISPRLVKGHPDLGKGSVRSQRLTFWCSSIVRIGRRPVTAPAVEVGVPPTDPCYPPARVEANACGLGKHGLHHVDPRASACARRGGVSSRQRTRRERHRGKRGKRAQHRRRYERPAFLHSSSLLRFGLGVVASRPRPPARRTTSSASSTERSIPCASQACCRTASTQAASSEAPTSYPQSQRSALSANMSPPILRRRG